jgi:hypothetical protein
MTLVRCRMGSRARASVLIACLASSLAVPARAAEPAASTALAAAERAYQDVDFASVRDEATRGIRAGGASVDETARLHVLLGIAEAALGDDEAAKRAFIVALGVAPTQKLDRSLSPKMRTPYLEAQGFWGAYPERLGLEEKLADDEERLIVHVTDPARLVAKIEAHVRALGAAEYEIFTMSPARTVSLPLSRDARRRGAELYVRALDAHGNALVELGSEGDARVEHVAAPRPSAAVAAPEAPPASERSYLLPAVLAGLGVGAAGVGVAFQLQREDAAHEWNGPGCEHPGASRIEQCGDVDARIQKYERAAIGAYVASGVLLSASLVSLLVGGGGEAAQGSERPATGVVGCAVGGAMVSCRGRF